jgi:hypothetical protein
MDLVTTIYETKALVLKLIMIKQYPAHCHHMSLMDFVVSPPGCGRSVADF